MTQKAASLDLMRCLGYLRRALPIADQMMLDGAALRQVAEHCLQVRQQVSWGASVPENLFFAFVLFPRVNNEDFVFYHEIIWKELQLRLAGKSMEAAIREVNYWCYEKAVYQSTDERTANALTIIKRAFGRCGEESVLLVSALRACGIPARQVYVPRWSHCDDNHAWVEAWADGSWHYLGACEPEPVLDSGWFTAAASKAMLIHTRAYGVDLEDERTEGREGQARIINRTSAYAVTAEWSVRVTVEGRPLAGVHVEYELLNMAELYPIHMGITDQDGCVSLVTGLGTIHLHVHDGKRYVEQLVKVKQNQQHLDIPFDHAVLFEDEHKRISQRPPKETKIQRSDSYEDACLYHQWSMKKSEKKRADYEATFDHTSLFLSAARGNGDVIRRFLKDERFSWEDKTALLETLREKDLVDATEELLTDALQGALPYKEQYPLEVWKESVLCPRVSFEMLYPDRLWLHEITKTLNNVFSIWARLQFRFLFCAMFPRSLIPRMRAVWKTNRFSRTVRDILFVNICRANGIAARLNPMTGEKEWWNDGAYEAVIPQRKPDAALVLLNKKGRVMRYGTDFSVARLEHGTYHTLKMTGAEIEKRLTIPVSAGHYRVICCTRQIDGSVDAVLIPVSMETRSEKKVLLSFPPDRTKSLIKKRTLPGMRAHTETEEITLPQTGAPAIVAMIAPGQEPTEHFLNELLESGPALEKQGITIQLLREKPDGSENEKVRQVLNHLPNVQVLHTADPQVLREWREKMEAGDLRLPLLVAVDAEGNGRFAFTNYHVGSVSALIQVLTLTKKGADA